MNIFYGWWIVAISFVVHSLSTGLYWLGFSVFFLPISRDLDLSRTAASLPFTLRGIVGILQSPFVGLLVDRLGPGKVLFVSATVGGLGFLLLSRVDTYTLFLIVFLCVVSLGMTSLDAPTTTATSRWFTRKRGLAMSLGYMGFAFGGIVLTPLLALWLAGQYLPVPAGDMAWDIVRIVLIPVVGGLVLRLLLPRIVQGLQPALPWISVLGITYVVLAVVAGSHDVLASAGALLLLGVIVHNLLGYTIGYGAAMLTRAPVPTRRAISVEVGMQNSGLAAGLAGTHFSPEAALPGAIFSVWHNISGGLLASFWGSRRPKAPQSEHDDASTTPVAT